MKKFVSKLLKIDYAKYFSFVFILYFLLNFSSYYLGGVSFLKQFVNGNIFKYGTKLLSYFILFSYSFLFLIQNGDKSLIKKNVILFSIVFLVSFITIFTSPLVLQNTYTNSYGYTVVLTFTDSPIIRVIDFANSVIDAFIAIFFVFVFRTKISEDNLTKFFIFISIFTVAECVFSIITEFNEYIHYFISNSNSAGFNGYETNISGTFLSKNGFGFLLFQGYCSSIFLYFLNKRKKWLFISFLPLCISIFSLCKTSAICCLVIFIFVLAQIVIKLTKKHLATSLIIFASLSIIIILLCAIKNPVSTLFNKFFNKVFLLSGNATINSRILIWTQTGVLVKPFPFIFGYGKNTALQFLYIATDLDAVAFHNIILDTLFSRGIIILFLNFFLFAYALREKLLNCRRSWTKAFYIILFIAPILYGMMETTYFLVTSSSVLLTFSLIFSSKASIDNELVWRCTYVKI